MAEDGSISQDEIDALLSLGDDADEGGGGGGDDSSGSEIDLNALLGGGGGGGGFEDSSSVGLDQASLDALAGSVGGGGSGRSSSGGGSSTGSDSRDNVDLLMDVTLRLTVELGRTSMLIKDVLMLGDGSIVELDKNVGDEVDILVNDRLFGRGRLIIMDEYFGVQITHILDPLDRFRNL